LGSDLSLASPVPISCPVLKDGDETLAEVETIQATSKMSAWPENLVDFEDLVSILRIFISAEKFTYKFKNFGYKGHKTMNKNLI
jgi:hypothetical protein